jgi:hypothetical protein
VSNRPFTDEQRVEAFWAKVDKTEGCWLWTGARGGGKAHYGVFSVHRKVIYAHKYAYEMVNGPVPEGMEIDHVVDRGCTSTLCVNPAHLEAVTHAENMRRWISKMTHCTNGHEFSEENTYWMAGIHRQCRRCHADRERARRARADAR